MDRLHFESLLSTRLKRRGLLIGAGALTGLGITTQFSPRAIAQVRFSDYPFKLGVASGDPDKTSVVLWTRLAPDPLNGGGMPQVPVSLQFQVATDARMRRVVSKGTVIATPELAHSVRVVVGGLQPGRRYWYQFKAGSEVSPIGRTRTAPSLDSEINQINFAFMSCQDWQNGFFAAHKYMAQEDLDFVVHLGDYIYEYGPDPNGARQHNSPEIFTLDDYRNRYALYKTDPNLQALHAAFPWIVTPDDHEVENNYANNISEIDTEPDQDRQVFLQRRAAAYKAYYEHMPLRPTAFPNGPDIQLYRRFTFGNLAEFHVLDTRQYRTDQPCNDTLGPQCPGSFDPAATLTGQQQEQWLFQGLDQSPTRWNVLAQQTMMGQFNFGRALGVPVYNPDQWDGYVAARNRLFNFLQQRKPSNPVVISGDIHSSWVHDLKADFSNPASETLATEFVGTSISSDFPAQFIPITQAALVDNPHTKFFDGALRGYVRCKITPDQWQSDYRVISDVRNPNATVSTLASFVVENGQPGAQRV